MDAQVEQDLVLSRALVELFSDLAITTRLAFRGGTALHKLCFEEPGRYSEDIDLVQQAPGPIGPIFDAIRARLDPWLGDARSKQGEGRASLVYRFETTTLPVQRARLKVEISTREHINVLGPRLIPFAVESPWFTGEAEIATFTFFDANSGWSKENGQFRERPRRLRSLWSYLARGDPCRPRAGGTWQQSGESHMTTHMTTRLSATILTFIALFAALPTSPSAVQGAVPPPAGAGPADRNDCFADFVDHVKQCRDTFCPNRLTDCNQAALDACMSGARAVLDDCLADQG